MAERPGRVFVHRNCRRGLEFRLRRAQSGRHERSRPPAPSQARCRSSGGTGTKLRAGRGFDSIWRWFRALADGDPGEALFRYRVVPGAGTRTVRFGLDGLAELLPRVERSCGPR